MNAPQFFVAVDSYWAGSKTSYVGPFTSKDDAQKAIDDARAADGSLVQLAENFGADVRYGVRVLGIVSKSKVPARAFEYDDEGDNYIITPESFPLTIKDLN